MLVLVPLLAVLAAGLWRFAPGAAAWAASALTLVAAVAVAVRWPRSARSAIPTLALLAALVTMLRLAPWPLWPCEAACDGGAHYQTVLGLPALAGALAAYLLLAALAFRERHRDHLSWPVQALGWLLAGCSAYYLHLMPRLDLTCPHCLAVHGIVLAWLPGLARAGEGWRSTTPRALAAALIGALALHAAFHPGVVDDRLDAEWVRSQQGPTLSSGNKLAYAVADAARRRGGSDAPVVLELVVDFQCPRCATLHRPLKEALQPALAANRAELVVRHLVRRSEPASRPLARLAFAAAMGGQEDYDLFVGAMLGSPATADERTLRKRVAEAVDPLILDGRLDANGGAADRLVADDLQRLLDLQASPRTPQLIAVDRASGRVLKRWSGEIAVKDVAEWLK